MECHGPVDEETDGQVIDIWAGINLNTLCRHLNMGSDELTHPWDVMMIQPTKSDLNSTGSSKPESKRDYFNLSSKDPCKESSRKHKGDSALIGDRELVRHLFTLKKTARNPEKSVIFGRTVRPKRVFNL